jgi:hypothetical protein
VTVAASQAYIADPTATKGTLNHDAPLFVALPLFVATDLAQRPHLRALARAGGVLLHGSRTFGIDDAFADIDLWLLAPAADVAAFDQKSPTRFIEFKLDGVVGHYSVEVIETFAERITRCDFPLIAELRYAKPIGENSADIAQLLTRAARPMSPAVQAAWFKYHYIEFRSDHRALDNPLNRGDATATLLAVGNALAHALRAACLLDGAPYHYSKWLAHQARRGPTGARAAAIADSLLELIATDALRLRAPESNHPINLKLKEFRNVLIESAVAAGLDGDYLHHWWLHLNAAREDVHAVSRT